jgi:hypothetical protein
MAEIRARTEVECEYNTVWHWVIVTHGERGDSDSILCDGPEEAADLAARINAPQIDVDKVAERLKANCNGISTPVEYLAAALRKALEEEKSQPDKDSGLILPADHPWLSTGSNCCFNKPDKEPQ